MLKIQQHYYGNMGIGICDDKLFTLDFANDQVTTAEGNDIRYMSRKLDLEYMEWGLTINHC